MELALAFVLLVGYALLKDRMIREERVAWTRERAELLNRIKPETAQAVQGEKWEQPPAVLFDDDESHWESLGVTTNA